MELTFEAATVADASPIFRLSKELIDRYEDCSAIDYPAVMRWVEQKIRTNIGTYRRILLHGQLAGYYRFVPSGAEMELDDLYILPEFQNRGIGSEVLRHCCVSALPVMLYVFTRNHRAISLYRRFGFETVKEVGATRLIMRRPAGGLQANL